MTKNISRLAVVVAWALPVLALAQSFDAGYGTSIIDALQTWVSALIPLLIGVALVVFFIGLVRYIWGGTDDSKVMGRKLMLWGIIAIAVMVSIWGIVALLQNIFGVSAISTPPSTPTVPGL